MKPPTGLLPNPHAALSIVRARVEGSGKFAKTVSESFRVIGFQVEAGVCTPITPVGMLKMEDGWLYCLFDVEAKTWMDLRTGTSYDHFSDFTAPLWKSFGSTPVAKAGEPADNDTKSVIGGPQPWR